MTGSIVGWRVYYPDGSTVDSTQASPSDVPDGACRVVEFLEPPYRETVPQGDYYVWDGHRWSSTGTPEEWGTWKDRPDGVAVVKSCERHDPEQIDAVIEAAMEDREWPT